MLILPEVFATMNHANDHIEWFLFDFRKIFPFDKPRFTKLIGQKEGAEAAYVNGTGELKGRSCDVSL